MKDSRHVEILQELDRKSVVSVKELKELFGVTDMTIRRDLIDLEKTRSFRSCTWWGPQKKSKIVY